MTTPDLTVRRLLTPFVAMPLLLLAMACAGPAGGGDVPRDAAGEDAVSDVPGDALIDAVADAPGDATDVSPDGTAADAPDAPDVPSTRCGGVALPPDPMSGHVTVFQGGLEGDPTYPVYRIPAFATTAAGVLVVVTEARMSLSDPGAGHIDLAMKRSLDCGRTWTPLEVLADNGEGDAHNPVLVDVPRDGGGSTLFLFFGQRPASPGGEFDLPPGTGPDSASIWVRTSDDDGATWSPAQDITAGVKPADWRIMSFGPGRGLVTRWGREGAPAGRILAPGWFTASGDGEGVFVVYSDDGGRTFHLGGSMPEGGEPQVVELADGTLLMDARGNPRLLYRSVDGGLTWSGPEAGMPMTPVMSSVIRHQAKRDGAPADRLLRSGLGPKERLDVRVWQSTDEGETWHGQTIFNDGIAQYSVLSGLDDGTVGLVWEGYGVVSDAVMGPTILFTRFDADILSRPAAGLPPLPLRVAGRHVVDADGARVRLQGVNWNGGHEENLVPTGLDHHTPAAIAAKLRAMGFNHVRLTYSDRLVRDDPVPPDAALAANPDLRGRPAMAAFDAVVRALADAGLLVILNNHMSDAAWCCSLEDGNALWYNERFSEDDWIANWVRLARRYRGIPAVVGADLRNEPRMPALWGAGGASVDWPAAAERCGRALLAENPDLLLFVEGIGFATDLTGVIDRPIDLPAANLAYSAHDYPWSMPGSASSDYDGYAQLVDAMWGHLLSGTPPRPVWLGEFGTGHDALGADWWTWIGRYVAERDLDWSLWLIFAYGDSTWGLLDPVTLEPADDAFWQSLSSWMAARARERP